MVSRFMGREACLWNKGDGSIFSRKGGKGNKIEPSPLPFFIFGSFVKKLKGQ